MAALDIAVLAIYILFLSPILYCLWKHGKPGILGWLPLQSFCVLRIVGSILNIHNESAHSTSANSLLLANIGLSPLLLAGAGVLHEARTSRNPTLPKNPEWIRVLSYHALIILAMVLIIFSVIKEMNNEPHTPNILMKIGLLLILLSWVILGLWTAWSWFRTPENAVENGAFGDGTVLLLAILRGLPLVGLRTIYSLLGIFLSNPAFKKSTAAKVVMSFVPEILFTALLAFVGVRTRNISKAREANKA